MRAAPFFHFWSIERAGKEPVDNWGIGCLADRGRVEARPYSCALRGLSGRLRTAVCCGRKAIGDFGANGDDESDGYDHVKDGGVARVAVGIEKVRHHARAKNDGGHLRVRRRASQPQRETGEQSVNGEAAVREQQIDSLNNLREVHLHRDVEDCLGWGRYAALEGVVEEDGPAVVAGVVAD